MLSNAYFLAKFRFDTAENEPAKKLQNFANFATLVDLQAQATGAKAAGRARGGHEVRERERRVRVGVELPLRVAHALVHEGLLRLLNNIE